MKREFLELVTRCIRRVVNRLGPGHGTGRRGTDVDVEIVGHRLDGRFLFGRGRIFRRRSSASPEAVLLELFVDVAEKTCFGNSGLLQDMGRA